MHERVRFPDERAYKRVFKGSLHASVCITLNREGSYLADVRLEGITKTFGEVVAVRDVSLDIADEEFLVLVGPSGSGKSTVLRIIAGLEVQTSGHVFIGGTLVDDIPPKGRDIAMVFQNYALYPHMNVYENMAFGLKLNKVPRDEIDRRVKACAQMLGIADLLGRRPRELSGGQRQRVALGRAIVRQPRVFLMDEPLSNLDAKLRAQMRTELQKLQRSLRTTTVYVTHDQLEAMTMGDRIAVLKDGVLQQVDTPDVLYGNPVNMFVAGFIGSPAMNMIEGRLEQREQGLVFADGGLTLPVPDRLKQMISPNIPRLPYEVVLGVRPEDLVGEPAFQEAHPSWLVDCQVEVVEPMGSEVYLHLVAGTASLTARVGPHVNVKDGMTWRVAVNMEKVHLFDAKTEMNLVKR